MPTHAARVTGKHVPAILNTGSNSPPLTQKFTHEARIVTEGSEPTSDEVSVVTKPHRTTVNQDIRTHNVHLTTGNADSTPNTNKRFRNIIPHGHNIHITHLVHDPVHPAINKRSINEHSDVIIARRRQKLRHRNKRRFAVPAEDFQPQHIRPTTKKPPQFVVKETHAFLVDPVDHCIKVNDSSHIGDHTFIQFYVSLLFLGRK